MSDARLLLEKITAFRQRLEQGGVFPTPPRSDDPDAREEGKAFSRGNSVTVFERALKQLRTTPDGTTDALPTQLTARARRLLEEGRALVADLKAIGDDPLLHGFSTGYPIDAEARTDVLVESWQEVVAMTDTALSLVRNFPDTPSVQLRLSAGLSAILETIRVRVVAVRAVLERRRRTLNRLLTLAEVLHAVYEDRPVRVEALTAIAEGLLGEAEGDPLRLVHAHPVQTQLTPQGPELPPNTLFIAAHSLNTANVLARLVIRDRERFVHPVEAVMAALLHDVAMLAVPIEALAGPGNLIDPHKRIVEAHPRLGAEKAAAAFPMLAGLVPAIAGHHERLDGTGYPAGLRDDQLPGLSRLLAVVDVYTALSSPRPYRSAYDSRSALTDTLVQADKGLLDRMQAAKLLSLGFYPVGSLVELSDGRAAVTVTAPKGDAVGAGRPVIAILTAADGSMPNEPPIVDLRSTEGLSIVRAVSSPTERKRLARRFPAWAA